MALEVIDGKEESGKKKEGQSVNPEMMDILKRMEERIQQQDEEIKKLNSRPQSGGIGTDFATQLASALNNKDTLENGQYVFNTALESEDQIDPSDILAPEEYVTFVSHMAWNSITSDKRHGRSVKPPFGIIKFDYQFTNHVKSGKETDVSHVCRYVCKSRTELNWLRNHSLFGISFFDSIEGALSEEGKKAQRLSVMMSHLSNRGRSDLLPMARQNGVTGCETMEISQLRAAIATAIVNKQIEDQEKSTRLRLNESIMETTMLSSK